MTRTKQSARKSKARRRHDHSLRPKGLVCRTCGDEGFNNAFVYCVKCLEFAVHRYCLNTIPKVLNGLVIWFCENCKPLGPYRCITTKNQRWRERRRLKRQRKFDSLEAGESVSCPKQATKPNHGDFSLMHSPLEEALVKSDLGPNQITRSVVLGLANCIFPKKASESAQLDNCYSLNGSVLPKDEHLQIQEESAKSSPYGKTTSHKTKQNNETTIPALLAVEDSISCEAGKSVSCPKQATKPNHGDVSLIHSPLEEALVKSDLGPNQITRSVVLGLAKCNFPKKASESAQLDNCYPLNGSVLPKDEHLQIQEESAKSSPYGKTTSHKTKQNNETAIPALLAVEDSINCPEGGAEPNYECVSPTNFLPKEAPVNLALGPNQIAPCVEKGVFQKQFSQSAELENYSLTGSAEKKRDTMFLPMETGKHKTQRTTDTMEHSSCDSSCTDITLKGKEDKTPSAEEQKCDIKPFDCGHAKLVSNSLSIEKELNKKTEDNDGQILTANHMLKEENMRVGRDGAIASTSAGVENNVQYINPQPAIPFPETVWRGNFSIVQTDYDLFEGFVAHLSSKAGGKAIQEARTLPKLLSLQMQPQTDLWPKSFLESPPDDDKIGLYFFPGNTKNKWDFKRLVTDMIDENLAMRTPTKNAELLIFTSIVLPPSFWKFDGNYYLWGVFRRKRNDVPLPVDAISNNGNNCVCLKDPETNQQLMKKS